MIGSNYCLLSRGSAMGAVFAFASIACFSACGAGSNDGGLSSSPNQDAGSDAVAQPDARESEPPGHTVKSLIVSPTNSLIELDLNTTSSKQFTVEGRFLDGASEDLTDLVTWKLSLAGIGTMSGPTLNISAATATGVRTTLITAEYEGVSGQAQLTVVSYRMTGPQQDFFFVLPYQDTNGEQVKPLEFGSTLKALDVFFNMDTTGSMSGEINNLRTALVNQIINPMQAQIPNTQFGAGEFQDFPVERYGSHDDEDQPFKLRSVITADTNAVQAAVDAYQLGWGWDEPEAMIESLYQIATGEGLAGPSPTYVAPNHSGIGGVGFRQDSLPVIVTVSDAISHTVGETSTCSDTTNYEGEVAAAAHSRTQAKDALAAICARVVGIASPEGYALPGCSAQSDEEDFARATGALIPPSAWGSPRPSGCTASQCCTGLNGVGQTPDADGLCPLVFVINANGTGLGGSVITALQMLTRYGAFDVVTETVGEATALSGAYLPQGKTTAGFVKAVVPEWFEVPASPPGLTEPIIGETGFQNVSPGTTLWFQVKVLNDFLEPGSSGQLFRATIRVLAGGCAGLDEREVLILVPPAELEEIK